VFADETYAGTASNLAIQQPRMAVREGIFTWMADEGGGLFRFFEGLGEALVPAGPFSEKAVHLSADRAGVLVSAGGYNSVLANRYSQEGAFQFENEQWKVLNRGSIGANNKFFDVIQAKYDPYKPGIRYLLPWGGGLVVLSDTGLQATYDGSNSSLQYINGSVDPNTGIGDTRVGGIDFDLDGNVWMSNYGAARPISVLRSDGSWESFPLGPFTEVIDMLVDNSGNKWVRSRSGGVVVLDRENSRFVNPNTAEGSGGLPSPIVNCLAKDKSGAIWIGTAEGPAVFFNPNAVFRDRYDAQQIKIQQEQFVGFLLGNEVITAIAIDGADRKWFGTTNGVWLFSADGTRQIHHFTTENSPILSNIVTSLAIHPVTGEVFIGTDRGIISYRGTATEGAFTHSEVKVFPNPVRPEYEGMISVSGLVTNNWIKITDISGNLVYQTRADGGQVSWNGRDLQGQKVAAGVYLVFSTSDFGEERVAAKVVIVR
jgi:ligand-binding sensor domain-containing protein